MMSSITLLVLTLLAITATASQNYGDIKSEELCISPSDHYHNQIKRAVIRERSKIWDNGIIPYVFQDGKFTLEQKAIIHQSMNEWMKDTCIQFKERTNEMNYILFTSHGPFCFTHVGMTGGLQEVNVGALCFHYPGYIVHELGHTLGLWHEHVRPDRDKFIEILWENIMTDKEYNFNIEPRRYIQSFSSDYDYGSIMHYSLNAFSKNGKPTMKPKRAYTGTIGQRNAPTDSDYLQLRYLYGCQKYLPPCNVTEGSGEYYKYVTLSNDDGDDRNCTNDILPFPSPTEDEETNDTSSTQHSYLLPLQSISSSSFSYSPFPYSSSIYPQDTLSLTTISDIIDPTTTIAHTVHTTNQELSLSMHSLIGTRHQKEASSLSAMLSSVDINTNNVIMIRTISSTVLTCTSHPIMPSCTMQEQQTDPTMMQESTADLLSVSHEMSPTPTNAIWNSIASGDKVALKVANANNTLTIHWMSCFPERCRVKCCENETEGYPYCPMSLFTLEKISQQSSSSEIRVGDLIVLRPDYNSEMIITCGKGACRGKTYCPILTTKKCKRHHLKIHSLNKKDGDLITHNDTIELRFNTLPNDYIECNVNGRRCKRHSCHDCSMRPNFIIVKSS